MGHDEKGDHVSTDPAEPVNDPGTVKGPGPVTEGEVLEPQDPGPETELGSVDAGEADAADAGAAAASVAGSDAGADADAPDAPDADAPDADSDPAAQIAAARAEAAERTEDLKRLQAEYVNYKRRVDRDRELQKEAGIERVLMDLFGTLDDLRAAEQHEELSGGFKLVAEEIVKVTRKYGLEDFGKKDDPFDPQIHEAMMQVPTPGITEPVCLDVMQVGYRRGGRVLRAARVAVGMPASESSEND